MMEKDPSERAKSLGLLCTSPTHFVSASSSLHVSQRTDRGRNMLATTLARSLHGKYGTTSLKLVSVIKEHSPAEEPFLLWGWHEEDGPVPFVGPNTSRYTNANALSVAKEVNPRRIRCEQNFNNAQIGWRHQNEAEEISSCLIMLKKRTPNYTYQWGWNMTYHSLVLQAVRLHPHEPVQLHHHFFAVFAGLCMFHLSLNTTHVQPTMLCKRKFYSSLKVQYIHLKLSQT